MKCGSLSGDDVEDEEDEEDDEDEDDVDDDEDEVADEEDEDDEEEDEDDDDLTRSVVWNNSFRCSRFQWKGRGFCDHSSLIMWRQSLRWA